MAVRRYWRAIAAVADDTLTVVAAHSGPMRALVAHAFHEDLGEPHNLEAVAIHLEGARARVDYRGRTADIAVPELDERLAAGFAPRANTRKGTWPPGPAFPGFAPRANTRKGTWPSGPAFP